VGSGKPVRIEGVDVENVSWTLEKEVDYFRELDIGLYPLVEGIQAHAKHGFKLQQYMACGVPAVVSAIGANPELVRDRETAFLARTAEDWHRALSSLVRDRELRLRVGRTARGLLSEKVSLDACTPSMVRILRAAASSKSRALAQGQSDLAS
jgi:glycosyltransferase involved in cell wall biosynthesis